MGGDGKVFTLAEVSQHTSNQDCWIVIDGKVPLLFSLSFICLIRSGSHYQTVTVDLLYFCEILCS